MTSLVPQISLDAMPALVETVPGMLNCAVLRTFAVEWFSIGELEWDAFARYWPFGISCFSRAGRHLSYVGVLRKLRSWNMHLHLFTLSAGLGVGSSMCARREV